MECYGDDDSSLGTSKVAVDPVGEVAMQFGGIRYVRAAIHRSKVANRSMDKA